MDQQPMQFQPNERLEISLEAQQWNVVLAALYEIPYRHSAPIIDVIRLQSMSRERNVTVEGD
jgi:hypothetical protein